ncbi:iron uptake system protein EfeO [Pseudoclavibacter soli]|uniref:iron uptake system protein EfeO n=1 Tax=Pseudoclavibacter soli TaxID=452623 RepID=UPI0003FF2E94|nr:iron uptake system protein EfeO [Pseudoclavibacter soli]
MKTRITAAAAGTAILALGLSGCVANTGDSEAIKVSITDDTCQLSTDTAVSGNVEFTLVNNGSQVNEFEILAEDQLQIVAEKENLPTGGAETKYVAQLQPGTYYTLCKPGLVGAGVGKAQFTVTGDEVEVDATEQAAIDSYTAYVKSQAGQLLTATETFVEAYKAGDTEKAKELFPLTRQYYERIEPTAEQFGDLDPKIDYRLPGAEEERLEFTGFHRIEQDLWLDEAQKNYPDKNLTALDADGRAKLGDQLQADIQQLYDLVYSDGFSLSLADITNGAIGLLDEVAAPDGKLPGEEDEFSHTDLYDFYANVEGAEQAYKSVRSLAEAKGDEGKQLVKTLDDQFASMKAALEKYGNFTDGFVDYSTVTQEERNTLGAELNALSEPLSTLTHTVLGVEQSEE